MNHQDLLAWQQVRETRPVSAGAGPILLAQQDPRRVYLLLTRSDGDPFHASTTMPTASGQGIQVGLFTNPVSPGSTIDPQAVSQNTLSVLELTYAQHGALVKSQWWAWDNFPLCPFFVQEVLMELDPQEACRGVSAPLRSDKWQKRPQCVRRRRHDGYRPLADVLEALRDSAISDLFKSV